VPHPCALACASIWAKSFGPNQFITARYALIAQSGVIKFGHIARCAEHGGNVSTCRLPKRYKWLIIADILTFT